jgi:hypothetical protein
MTYTPSDAMVEAAMVELFGLAPTLAAGKDGHFRNLVRAALTAAFAVAIESGEARVKELEGALKYFACNCVDTQGDEGCRHDPSLCPHNAARTALGDTND